MNKDKVTGPGDKVVRTAAVLCTLAFGLWPLTNLHAAGDADDTQDVLYVGMPHPVLIRLHLRVEDRSAVKHWDDCLEKFFAHLDRNRSGGLDPIEARKAPSAQQMLQFFQGNVYIFTNPRARPGAGQVDFAQLDSDRDGKVTLDEFKEFYRKNGAGPVVAQAGFAYFNPGGQDGLTDAVFNLLDTNKDGKLSRAELEAAEQVLMKYDGDDNELISQQELGLNGFAQRFRRPVQVQLPGGRMAPQPSNLMLVARDDGRRAAGRLQIARDILARYDKDRDGKLSPDEIGFPKKLFDELDRNKDGKLNVLELVRWAREKPAGEFTVRLRDSGAMMRRQAMMRHGGKVGDMSVDLEGVRITVVGQSAALARNTAQFLQNQFEQLDGDNKGFITRKQVENQQYAYLRGLFDLGDRNNDGRLTRQEIKDCLALLTALQGAQVQLSIASTGQGLFQTLDANGDGQLSVRELRNAWKALAAFDRDGDGCISRNEFPQQFRLTVARSPQGFAGNFPVVQPGMPGRALPRGAGRGPLWFRKMDRNSDGDVSRREWLGTREQFDQIDTDRDGLISVEEAEAYDARVRKKE